MRKAPPEMGTCGSDVASSSVPLLTKASIAATHALAASSPARERGGDWTRSTVTDARARVRV